MKTNQIFKFCLLSAPIVLTSLFFSVWQSQRVEASETQTINLNVISPNLSKVITPSNLEQNQYGDFMLNFTNEESDASIEMFGCDCITSLNKLKRLRGLTVGVHGELLTDNVLMATCPHQQLLGT
ncbi:hypothetical protein [Geminocystis sp. NIES-3709]|uniref:hypothetical protein n=1 Tax=Geminocystis sp. NIES-3709 TaxID=1617448 RepID=UPI0005FCCE4F|nr:hypothetical protein [Geminocystis sp. NIES-3709]BAQ63433.1 hypothetical protein GM3709_198 [Geminocystis sp. NIES-3709]